MVKKITFYSEDEAIVYRLKMRRLGYAAKIIHVKGKYEVIVAGEVPEWRGRTDWGKPE
jgi:hypothetical protein